MNGILCYSSQVGDLLTGGIAPKAFTSAFGWVAVGGGRWDASGSSYGSVVLGQAAVSLVEDKGLQVKTLTLSASPINKGSELGQKLLALEEAGKIGKIVWQPNKGDNVTGAAGRKSLLSLIFGKPSVLLPKHPHNKAMKDTARTGEIVQKTIVDEKSEGEAAAQKASKQH